MSNTDRGASSETPATPPAQRTRPRLLLPTLVAFLIGGVVLIVLMVWNPMAQTPPPRPVASGPVEGTISVVINAPQKKKIGLSLEDEGALPVRADEWMSLESSFDEPVYAWMVWLDPHGNVTPLYPWNDGTIEVKDANAAPPERRPARMLRSPAVIGAGWKFGKQGGLETVLLLTRRTPLDRPVPVGDLLKGMPPTKMRSPNEHVGLRFDRGQSAATTVWAKERGSEAEAKASDAPLLERMERLREHFDTVWAIRFAHAGD